MRTLLLALSIFTFLPLKAEISLTPLVSCICEGQATQAFELIAEGTAGPFTFEWSSDNGYSSTVQNPSDITMAGMYEVVVSNAYGCSTTFNINLDACPGVLNPIQFQLETNCSSGGGNVTATVTGEDGDLSYEWSNEVVGETISNVPAGTYTLTVTDDAGCSITGEVVVPVPEEPLFEIDGDVTPDCNPNGGSIILNMEGITAPYQIQWSLPGATGAQLTGLNNGDYYVTVTDANGCSNETEFLVYGPPVYEYEVENASCNTISDGRIELIESSGGNAQPVTITWSDGLGENQLIRENMPPGNYWVSIVGTESGCGFSISNINIEPDPEQAAYPYLTNLEIRAVNAISGATSIIYNGSWVETTTGCFEYMDNSENLDPMLVDDMSAGLVSWEVLATFSEPVAGGLIALSSQNDNVSNTLTPSTSTTLTTNVSDAQVVSLVGTSGSFDVSTNITAFTEDNLHNLNMHALSNGLADCVVIPALDPVSCEYVPPVPADAVGQDPTHQFGFSCVELSLEPSADASSFCLDLGGVDFADVTEMRIRKPQSSSWTVLSVPSPCFAVSSELIGEYCVQIRVNGCVEMACATYCDREDFTSTTTTVHPSCMGADDGKICIELSPINPNAAFALQWSNGETGNCITGLAPGMYSLSITPAGGCDMMEGYPLVGYYDLNIDAEDITVETSVSPACGGEENGEICIYAQGGEAPYTVIWSDGPTDNCHANISTGTYTYTIIDGCGAEVTGEVELPEANLQDDLTVTFPPSGDPSCNPQLIINIDYPTAVTVNIRNTAFNDVIGHGFQQTGNGEMVFENIPSGEYWITITDDCGDQVNEYHTIEAITGDLIAGIDYHGKINCKGGTGMLTVNTTGEGTPPYTYAWSNGETTQTISDIPVGIYWVTVTDQNGCEDAATAPLGTLNILDFEEEVTPACDGSNGVINLDVSGGHPPYAFEWSNSSTAATISNLSAGEYCVTITDAEDCEVEGCFMVEDASIDLTAEIQNHDCSSVDCNGSITLNLSNVNEVSFLWSTGATSQNLTGVCSGEYAVTVTLGECVEVFSFNLGAGDIYDLEFFYFIESDFYSQPQPYNDGRIIMESNVFDSHWSSEIDISVFTDVNLSSEAIGAYYSFNGTGLYRKVTLTIPSEYSDYDRFYMVFTTEEGCRYRGEILFDCTADNALLEFYIDYEEDESQVCEPGLYHTYDIHITDVGPNFPYFINIGMREWPSLTSTATYPEDADFRKIITIEEDYVSPVTVTGIPSGVVHFRGSGRCKGYADLGVYYSADSHWNCCEPLSCDIKDEGEFELLSFDSYEYIYRFFAISTIGSADCFDSESNVIIGPPTGVSNSDPFDWNIASICWEGSVEIQAEWIESSEPQSHTISTLNVGPHPTFEGISTVTIIDDNNFNPPVAGTYTIRMVYQGDGFESCEEELQIDFESVDSAGKAIGFVNDWWYNFFNITEEFEDVYYATWTCDNCNADDPTPYIWDNNVGECDALVDGVNPNSNNSTQGYNFFVYFPNNYNNPCDSGGTLTYQDFDENGNPVMRSVTIPAGKAVGEIEDIRPIWLDPELWCLNSGWCLFESIDVYGFSFPDGRRIVGSWADYDTCEPMPIFDQPNPDVPPCDSDNPDSWPPGYTCIDGVLFEDCEEDNDCLLGFCEDGSCIEEIIDPGNECSDTNLCPEGQECENGFCVDEITGCTRGLVSSYLQCGSNPCSFVFESNGPAILRVEFQTYGLGRMTINVNGTNHSYDCVQTAGTSSTDWIEYEIDTPGTVPVTISVASDCGEPMLEQFNWVAWCGTHPNVNGEDDSDFWIGGNGLTNEYEEGIYDEIRLYPNPFSDILSIEANIEAAFSGEIVVTNYQGTEILRQAAYFEEGYNTFEMEALPDLNQGLYIVSILKDGAIKAARTVVKM